FSRVLFRSGWATAVTGRSDGDAYADRFVDSLAGPGAQLRRRALGLARALRAGLLAATALPPPAALADLKPLLAAETALATGRHGAAVALREVLRELYPAALRAYPDPSDPVALAILDALPEPAALAERDTAAAIDSVAAKLVGGAADRGRIAEALTALRVAIAESPRSGLGPDVAAAGARAVRQAVAAVGCCDVARRALVDALAPRPTARAAPRSRHPRRRGPTPRPPRRHPPAAGPRPRPLWPRPARTAGPLRPSPPPVPAAGRPGPTRSSRSRRTAPRGPDRPGRSGTRRHSS